MTNLEVFVTVGALFLLVGSVGDLLRGRGTWGAHAVRTTLVCALAWWVTR